MAIMKMMLKTVIRGRGPQERNRFLAQLENKTFNFWLKKRVNRMRKK